MKTKVIVDTGPIVALLNRRDAHHEWAKKQAERIAKPMYTCESVITEAVFLLKGKPTFTRNLANFLQNDIITITHSLVLQEELDRVLNFLLTYDNLSASLTDACLVRMSENHPHRKVFTVDNHFRIYRRNGDEPLPLTIPN